MNKEKPPYFSYIVCLLLAVIHTGVTFITDKSIFEFQSINAEHITTAVVDYFICKILLMVVLYAFYYGLYVLFLKKDESHNRLVEILKAAAPYLIVIAGALIIKLPAGYITNDENSIYANAITLTHDTWFYYITTYYYIISIMLLPFKYGPIIVKAIIQFLTVGYVVYRIKKYYGKRLGMWGYLVFLIYPVIAYTTSAHRLPIYFLIYLVVFSKLLFDGLEEHSISRLEEYVLIFAGALLTQWRTEGIYLAVLIPILLLFAYKNLRNKRAVIALIFASLLIQYVVSIPQNGFTAKDLDSAANDRMKPFYAYTITNMYRNGLDLEKNAEDLAIVDKYLSLEQVKAINEYYVDINYEDAFILYEPGYVGVREEASVEDFVNYSDALKRIFINNPDVFIKTRIGAFCYAAVPYHITFSGTSVRELISFGISIVKFFAYNLFIPCGICLVLLVMALIKRRWYSFFVFGGLLAHWFIVFVLAPASYFKYYFPIYIMGYFYAVVLILYKYSKLKGKTIKDPLY